MIAAQQEGGDISVVDTQSGKMRKKIPTGLKGEIWNALSVTDTYVEALKVYFKGVLKPLIIKVIFFER